MAYLLAFFLMLAAFLLITIAAVARTLWRRLRPIGTSHCIRTAATQVKRLPTFYCFLAVNSVLTACLRPGDHPRSTLLTLETRADPPHAD
jgi:hypothetical protein